MGEDYYRFSFFVWVTYLGPCGCHPIYACFVIREFWVCLQAVRYVRFPIFDRPVPRALIVIYQDARGLDSKLGEGVVWVDRRLFTVVCGKDRTSIRFLFPLGKGATSTGRWKLVVLFRLGYSFVS